MKQLLITLSLMFAQEYNITLPPIDYRLVELENNYAITKKMGDHWEISIDKDLLLGINIERLKPLVYHQLGHTVGWPESKEKRSIMNSKYLVDKKYKYFRNGVR